MNQETRITCDVNVESSDIKKGIMEFNVAFVRNDIETILSKTSHTMKWHMIGDFKVSGLNEVKEAILSMPEQDILGMHISKIVVEGNQAVCQGVMTFSDQRVFHFCDVYVIEEDQKELKIKEMTSYVVLEKEESN